MLFLTNENEHLWRCSGTLNINLKLQLRELRNGHLGLVLAGKNINTIFQRQRCVYALITTKASAQLHHNASFAEEAHRALCEPQKGKGTRGDSGRSLRVEVCHYTRPLCSSPQPGMPKVSGFSALPLFQRLEFNSPPHALPETVPLTSTLHTCSSSVRWHQDPETRASLREEQHGASQRT